MAIAWKKCLSELANFFANHPALVAAWWMIAFELALFSAPAALLELLLVLAGLLSKKVSLMPLTTLPRLSSPLSPFTFLDLLC